MKDNTVRSFYDEVARIADTSGSKIPVADVYRVLSCAKTILQNFRLLKRLRFLIRWLS